MRKPRREPLKATSPRDTKRSPAQRRGALAEQVVADYLAARAFRIHGLNVRLGPYELDIVAQQDDLVVVVEVRHRGVGSWQSALESIGPAKIRRIRIAGERLWGERFADDPTVNRLRYDVATVAFEPNGQASIEYFAGAF